ncbi:MAG TPA: SPFH domain-containing protein [Planctomycetota bacterium]|nr:SPFH domain-containing protein [Planctomycetota bacterium]
MTHPDEGAPPPASPPSAPAASGGAPKRGGAGAVGIVIALIVCALPAYWLFEWFLCRIEVGQGRIAILVAKTGKDLPSGQIIAGVGEKGIQLEPLGEGRHFRNPLFWDWYQTSIAEVPPGKVGVLVRLFGKPPASGQVLVGGAVDTADPANAEKGILREVLRPGRYRVNPFAYGLEIHDAVQIDSGFVGIVTNLVGPTPAKRNEYVVAEGERGVQPVTLGPGTHYVNPYAIRIDPVDVRQRRFEFNVEPERLAKLRREEKTFRDASDHLAITFPSSDGFEIEVKLAVTWQVDPERAPLAFVRISTNAGEKFEDEIIHVLLTPVVRGYARIEGSKFEATQYISGASRSTFQKALLDKVKTTCAPKGIIVHEVLVSDIEPPSAIADPIRQREIAKEELARNLNQIKQAQSEQSLAHQTALVGQQRATVEGETKKIQQVIAAKNRQDVAVIEQEKLLTVAKTDLEAAKLQASAILSRGQAEADVIVAQNDAEAESLRRAVEAFRTPAAFAAYTFARRVAPGVQGVFADPSSAFGRLFTDMLDPAAGAGARKGGE